MAYATAAQVKERLDIAAGDTSQDTKIAAKITQANSKIDWVLKQNGMTVPVTEPPGLVNHLSEIEADYAAGLFLEDRGPAWKERANALKQRALDDLEELIELDFESGVAVA